MKIIPVLLLPVLLITTSFSGVIGAGPGEESPPWAKWIEPFLQPQRTGRNGFSNPFFAQPEENSEPENRWQQSGGNLWQQPFGQPQRPQGNNQFGNQWQNPFGQNQRPGQFGQNQRPDQFGQNQRPNQSGQNQRPDQFGQNQRPNQSGQNQRPDQFGQNQRPNQSGQNQRPDQFGQNQRPNQSGQNQRPDQFGQNQRPNQSGQNQRPDQFGQNQRPSEQEFEESNERPDQFGQNQRPEFGGGQNMNGALRPGDACNRNNRQGLCIKIYECHEVIQGIQQNRPPPRPCYVPPNDPVPYVCCLDRSPPIPTRPPTRPSTPKPIPKPPKPTQRPRPTPVKTERIAKKQCKEYAKYVYEIEESPALFDGPKIPVDKCVKSAEELIVGGVEADLGEFPHMALLGFGDNPEELSFDCGGSLISEDYILTAGHCIAERTPSHVLLGEHILRDDNDRADPQLIPIADRGIIPHPNYRWPEHYYDVALIRLERRPRLNPKVRPACLHTGDSYTQGSLIASGWGRTDWAGDPSDILMKVRLNEIPVDTCNRSYRTIGSKLVNGIKDDQQICAGRLEGGKDTCQGDSGGPLQVFRSDPHCTYEIVGVVSFGKGCALRNTPGVYARVRYFVDWIEKIVWPGLSTRSSDIFLLD